MSAGVDETDDVQVDETVEPDGKVRSRRRWRTVALVLAPLVLFALLLATGLGRIRVSSSELIGQPAPTFSLPRLDAGGTIDLDDLHGQVVVVNFWASWCVPCREEHDALAATWSRYRERGVVVLGVSFEDTREAALEFRDELRATGPSPMTRVRGRRLPTGSSGSPRPS